MTRAARSHDEWTELVCGLALDALEPEDETEVSAHLSECPACQELHTSLIQTAGELAALAEGIDPPAAVLEVLRAEIARTPRNPPLPGAPAPRAVVDNPMAPIIVMPAPRPSKPRLGRILIGSVSLGLVVAVSGTYAASMREQTVVASRSLTQQEAVLQGVVAAFHDPDAKTWTLESGTSSATVISSQGHGYLSTTELAPLTAAQGQYVLWGIRSDFVRVALASFRSGDAAVDLGSLDPSILSNGQFVVSREASGAVPANPQGPAVLTQVPQA